MNLFKIKLKFTLGINSDLECATILYSVCHNIFLMDDLIMPGSVFQLSNARGNLI